MGGSKPTEPATGSLMWQGGLDRTLDEMHWHTDMHQSEGENQTSSENFLALNLGSY